MTQADHYEQFLALHHQSEAFVMPNAWDGLSALILKQAGFPALGTSSAALAAALGRPDGRHEVTVAEHLTHAKLLIEVGRLPVNGDFEDGYGATPEDVAATVRAAIDTGLAGIGVEDTSGDPAHPIRDFDDAVARVRAAAEAGRGRIVLTGRTDNFLQGRNDLDDTIRRLTAFAEAGADVLYAPYPPDMAALDAIVKAVAPKPVNIVMGTKTERPTVTQLSAAGVKRISTGSALYNHAAAAVQAAATALTRGDLAGAMSGMPTRDVAALLASD
ncbi:2-methylisocitrate lyase [Mycobacterium florentinum]|uniref:2-methylisocitrate lyase n=1 Tax=Mycobacterium florentinum TaxID=292462 RepID=A0A1X1UDN9_MYCFL|nr:isocitrate lyase/phosphoenolpyruvate mutase family protein [Mycobacterium florentinum]MCV7412101.1 isocitrate lyase/phosphoenolpyruvate mutase family protein [Mycobacterium florentinum]ORV54924.1 2-methylisocitrate lyase [Mycobacterium florentinum]BBX81476.1 2-methylisocitrate lyase [Mycobacterium florentinum]